MEVEGMYIEKESYKKYLDEIKKKVIEPDEKIFGCFHGIVMKSNDERARKKSGSILIDFLVVTNKRVVFYCRGFFSRDITGFKYDDISSVESNKGIVNGKIILNIHGIKEYFDGMDKEVIDIAAKMIRENIDKVKRKSDDKKEIENSIDILKKRYAKGEITKREFEEIKKDLE